MSSTQIQAAKILLSKVAPDLQQQSATVVHAHSHTVRHIEINPVHVEHRAPQVIDSQADSVRYDEVRALLAEGDRAGMDEG